MVHGNFTKEPPPWPKNICSKLSCIQDVFVYIIRNYNPSRRCGTGLSQTRRSFNYPVLVIEYSAQQEVLRRQSHSLYLLFHCSFEQIVLVCLKEVGGAVLLSISLITHFPGYLALIKGYAKPQAIPRPSSSNKPQWQEDFLMLSYNITIMDLLKDGCHFRQVRAFPKLLPNNLRPVAQF